MNEITFKSILPALISGTVVLALLWLFFWLLTRAFRRWTKADGGSPDRLRHGVESITRFLRRVTGVASLVVAILIMLHGVGIDSVPRLTWPQIEDWTQGSGLRILFILGSALVLIRTTGSVTRRLPDFLVPAHLSFAERLDRRKRIDMRGRLVRWTITAVVATLAIVMVLKAVGMDLTPFLAGGAIISVALGFGAQDLVRDIIGGSTMILEDQLRVGDIASINGKSGLVEAIHLRTTVLRGLDGAVHIIPNGSIKELSNMTKNFSFYVIDLGIAYKENVDKVMDLLREIGRELTKDPAYGAKILAPLEVLGVDDFAASAVVIKLRIMTVPLEQWVVGRELRRRIKNRFDEIGIELPYPHMSVHFDSAERPAKIDAATSRLAGSGADT